VKRQLAVATFAAALMVVPGAAFASEPANGCQQYGRQLSHSAATGFDEPENPIGGYISDQAGAAGDPLWVDRDEDCPAPGDGLVLPGPPVDSILMDLPPNGPGSGPPEDVLFQLPAWQRFGP
jgi:hypothetical protein